MLTMILAQSLFDYIITRNKTEVDGANPEDENMKLLKQLKLSNFKIRMRENSRKLVKVWNAHCLTWLTNL